MFDDGYLAVDPCYRLRLSRQLRDEFGNGKQFYAQAGEVVALRKRSTVRIASFSDVTMAWSSGPFQCARVGTISQAQDPSGRCLSVTAAESDMKIEYFSVSAMKMSEGPANLEFENSTETSQQEFPPRHKAWESLGHGSTGGR